MKAAYIRQTGEPDVITYDELPQPEPGPGQVLVKVAAVAVNPVDTYLRSGAIQMPLEFPFIVGCDVAGTVEAVGDGVSRLSAGDRVWGSNQGLLGRQGTFAEYVAVDEEWLYKTPDSQPDTEAAAGALVGITAHLGLFLHGSLKSGELVFVNGGTGGVGSAVVQFAKAAGAHVIATVGSEQKAKLCRDLGADHVFDYHDSDLDDRIQSVAEQHGGIDIWWETQREPTFDRTISMLKQRGRIILMAGREARPEFPVGPFYVNDLRLIGFAMFNASATEQQECARQINEWAAGGKWKPLIGRTLPLAEAAEAHRLQEQNTLEKQGDLTGKIVLTVGS